MNQRQFKELKRRQIRAVLKAIDDFWMGAAACPPIPDERMKRDAEKIRDVLSVKNWGR